MEAERVLDVLADLSEGDDVGIEPATEGTFTPVFQPETGFRTVVIRVRERETRVAVGSEARGRRTTARQCREREITFEPHPDAEDEAYVTYRRTFPDGEVRGGTLYARNAFYDDRDRKPVETEIGEIERIDVL